MGFFSKAQAQVLDKLSIFTSDGKIIERVPFYKYFGIWIDDTLIFNVYIANLIRKLKLKLGFYFRNKSNFTSNAKKKLSSLEAIFLTVLDYGDILYMHAASIILTIKPWFSMFTMFYYKCKIPYSSLYSIWDGGLDIISYT